MEYNFKVNLGGMIDILSNHLYSSPKVFIRELLQNGTDAISARIKENSQFGGGKISISITKGETIRFRDNGIGLTEEEIHKFLAVIGQSSKRDLGTGQIFEDYIGRFGIGLLSCFMVTDEVTVRTVSEKSPEKLSVWVGKPDGTYTIRTEDLGMTNEDNPLNPPIGTEIIIHAKPGCGGYFEERIVTDLVRYYGLPLPFPVVLLRGETEVAINNLRLGADLMGLGEAIFGEKFISCIPLESKAGLFSGVAYILPYPVAANAEHQHRIYLKNMLLTEDGGRILPKWAFFIKCFLNSSALRPTASRENFYEDEKLKEAREEIAEIISDYLQDMSENNGELLSKIISVHSLAVKSIAVEDPELFGTFIPHLEFQTIFGSMTGDDLLTYDGTIFYTDNINRYRQLAPVFAAQTRLLVNAGYTYDSRLLKILSDCDEDIEIKFIENIDPEDFLNDVSDGDFDRAELLLDVAGDVLDDFDCLVQIKSFYPESLAVFYLAGEGAELYRSIKRIKEQADNIFFDMLGAFELEIEEDDASKATLFFNLNNTLVRRLIAMQDEEKIAVMTKILYVQALMTGHFPLASDDLDMLNDSIMKLMEEY